MLDGRGIDFESIGMAQGFRRAFDNLEAEASRRILAGNLIIAQQAAHVAGRESQNQALLRALREVDPGHPALQDTGLVWPTGQRALAYELAYEAAYDDVARARGITLSTGPMTPAQRAEAAVLAEPIQMRTVLFFFKRPFWRGVEYSSLKVARRERAKAARQAREAVR